MADPTDSLDDGDEVAALMARYWPLLVEAGYDGGADQLGMRLSFELTNPFVRDTIRDLATRVRGVAETTREDIRRLVGQATDEGWSPEQLAEAIRAQGITNSVSRSEMIARSEGAAAYSRGALLAYESSGVVTGVEWLVTDPCEICAAFAGKVVALGDEFGDGISHPPAHPRCKCSIAPVIGIS